MKTLLEKSRYLGLIGVIALLVASVAAFGWGAVKTVYAVSAIVTSFGKDPFITVALIEVADSFLIATALFIFSASMYELFVADLDLPNWMLAHNLYELKEKLGGVIILVMVVKFLEHLVEWREPYNSLLFAAAITIVSAALIALNRFNGIGRESKEEKE